MISPYWRSEGSSGGDGIEAVAAPVLLAEEVIGVSTRPHRKASC